MEKEPCPEQDISRIKALWFIEAQEYKNACEILRSPRLPAQRRVENIELKLHINEVSDKLLDKYLEAVQLMAQLALLEAGKAAKI